MYSVSSLLFCPFSFPSLFGQDKLTAPGTSASFDFSEKSVEVGRQERNRCTRYISGSNEFRVQVKFKLNSNSRFKFRYRETLANYRPLIGKVDILSIGSPR